MRHQFLKGLFAAAVAVSAMAIARAESSSYELLSHVVLNLPSEVGSETPWSRTITTSSEWNAFYGELLQRGTTVPAEPVTAPAIDFDTYQLVAGGLGMQTSGGYSVVVRKVSELSESLLIDVLFVRPGANCVVATLITYPTVAILVKKTNKPLRFSLSNLTLDCSS